MDEAKPDSPPPPPRTTYTVMVTILEAVGSGTKAKTVKTIVVHEASVRVVEDYVEREGKAGHDVAVSVVGRPAEAISLVGAES